MARTPVTTLIVLVVALATRITAQAAADDGVHDLYIAIAAVKDEHGRLTIRHHKHFNVLLTNRSDKPIRLWAEACQPGYDTLSFRITDVSGKSWTMRRTRIDRDWDDDLLKTFTIAPGATYEWRVFPTEIQQGTQSWTGMVEPNGDEVSMVPLFEIKTDARAKAHGVWTGRAEGQSVNVHVVNPNLITPHDYLWYQCPRQALKIMQADPKWINKEDPKDHCRPLHHASSFGFLEVVEWLLANGAEVDARAYNDFSPLALANDPQVVRAILRYKPTDKDCAATFFRAPLENAAEQVATGGSNAKKWREIVQLMLDAGASYSLQVAACLNDVARLRDALNKDARLVNSLEGSRYSPLRIAARHGHTQICKVLLRNNADPNDWENGRGFPILVDAIKHPTVVKLLIDAGADLKTRISLRGFRSGAWIIKDEATALHFAAEAGALETVKLLLDAGVDVNAKDTEGQTALDIAARCGQGTVAHLVASRMGTAEACDKGRRALLREFVFSAKSDRLKLALQEKVVADIFAREGPTFMWLAAREVTVAKTKRQQEANARNLEIIETLSGLGIPIDMYAAITSDNRARVQELLKADPALGKSKDQDKQPILQRATTLDRRAVAALLLGVGADANDPNADGYTALHSAAFWGRPEIAKLLIERGADVNARAKNGLTPLHEAVRLRSVEVARLLVASGAKADATDNDGQTPLSLARLGEELEMIKLLGEKGGKK